MKWEGEVTGDVLDEIWRVFRPDGFEMKGKKIELFLPGGNKVLNVGDEISV